jgi:pyridoxal phosphate enzyme (YggS family)
MPVNTTAYKSLIKAFEKSKTTLVAVSKTKPVSDILELYRLGQRDFGENYVQELVEKAGQLPRDIRWHFIGHLQSNKVKLILPIVQLIHGVDSLKLLEEIDKQARKLNQVSNCLLQVHIAEEETKFGLDEEELPVVMSKSKDFEHVKIRGLMGMASFSNNMDLVRSEFRKLKNLYDQHPEFQILSMGMSSDYEVALDEGSNMVRIGSLIFGERS